MFEKVKKKLNQLDNIEKGLENLKTLILLSTALTGGILLSLVFIISIDRNTYNNNIKSLKTDKENISKTIVLYNDKDCKEQYCDEKNLSQSIERMFGTGIKYSIQYGKMEGKLGPLLELKDIRGLNLNFVNSVPHYFSGDRLYITLGNYLLGGNNYCENNSCELNALIVGGEDKKELFKHILLGYNKQHENDINKFKQLLDKFGKDKIFVLLDGLNRQVYISPLASNLIDLKKLGIEIEGYKYLIVLPKEPK